MAYIGTGIDPMTGLPYATTTYVDSYAPVVNVGYVDPLAPGYVVGGGLGGGIGTTYVETTTYSSGTAIDPITGLPLGGPQVYY